MSTTSAMGVWPGDKRWDLTAVALCDHRDERLRRIGLPALTAAAGSGRGWDKSQRLTLAARQADLSPLAAAAQFTFPDHDHGAGEANELPEDLHD